MSHPDKVRIKERERPWAKRTFAYPLHDGRHVPLNAFGVSPTHRGPTFMEKAIGTVGNLVTRQVALRRFFVEETVAYCVFDIFRLLCYGLLRRTAFQCRRSGHGRAQAF